MEIVNLVGGLVQTVISVVDLTVKAAPTHRQCNIDITNECRSYTLCNPRMFTNSGRCSVPLPPRIPASTSGRALFSKTPFTARGSVGVFTYDLLDNSTQEATKRLAVMFNVPFDLNRKRNKYAVGLFDSSVDCDGDLFHMMAKSADSSFVRGKAKHQGIGHKSQNISIIANMSDCYEPAMCVSVVEEVWGKLNDFKEEDIEYVIMI